MHIINRYWHFSSTVLTCYCLLVLVPRDHLKKHRSWSLCYHNFTNTLSWNKPSFPLKEDILSSHRQTFIPDSMFLPPFSSTFMQQAESENQSTLETIQQKWLCWLLLAAALKPSQSVHENMVIVLLTRTMIKDPKTLAFPFSLCSFTGCIEIYVFNVVSYTPVSYLIYVVVPNDAEILSPLQSKRVLALTSMKLGFHMEFQC